VKVDPSELELALLNVAVNARDAMPNGGTLHLAIKPVMLKGLAQDDGLTGEFVAIRISDTGTGIPPDVLPRVFEPFFTTKEFGKGTGLGLSQVYGFARQSGGTATVTSTVGRGTSITLYLPRTHEAAETAKPAAANDKQEQPAGTVLIVEDNPEVADACAGYLTQLGYRVESVSDGRAALDFLKSGKKVDVVFSDILMPGGVNGLELATTIRATYPHLPVLLTTGYSASAQDAVRQNFTVLQKPYDLDALRRSLDEVRNGESSPIHSAAE
jgi:two-component system NtrC family sensor kinase